MVARETKSFNVEADDPLRGLIRRLCDIYEKPVQFMFDGIEFGIGGVATSILVTYIDVSEIISGDKYLNIYVLQLLMM